MAARDARGSNRCQMGDQGGMVAKSVVYTVRRSRQELERREYPKRYNPT